MRTRGWRQVLPPEEHERREEEGELRGEVIEPEATTTVPRMREPYEPLQPVPLGGPLARRTGSAPLRPPRAPATPPRDHQRAADAGRGTEPRPETDSRPGIDPGETGAGTGSPRT